ncbi:MAG: DUF177 domain-containing protein [Pyrinomonadaceae bacterium]
MIVDLGVLEKSVLPFEFSIQPGEIDLEDETAQLESLVKVEGELKKGIVQTDVSGKISAKVLLECSRCLAEVERNLEFPFEAAFVGSEHYSDAKEVGLSEADLNVSLVEDEKIDLTELAREQILLNLPEQVFCTEDCKGLCDKCGANRNLINCNCEEKEIDPRWAALKDLKRDT